MRAKTRCLLLARGTTRASSAVTSRWDRTPYRLGMDSALEVEVVGLGAELDGKAAARSHLLTTAAVFTDSELSNMSMWSALDSCAGRPVVAWSSRPGLISPIARLYR